MVSGVFVLPGGDSPEPKTPETVSASRLLRPGAGRLLLRSQAQKAAQRGKRRLAPAVPDAGMDRRSSPRPTPAGAVLPGVRPPRRPHSGHRRGPHPAPQGRLAAVHGPRQPAIPVPFMSQPAKPWRKCGKNNRRFARAKCARVGHPWAHTHSGPMRRDSLHPSPGVLKFRGGPRDRRRRFVQKIFPTGHRRKLRRGGAERRTPCQERDNPPPWWKQTAGST